MWSGAPRKSEPLWHGYYHLGYSMSSLDCPNLGPDPEQTLASRSSEWLPIYRVGWLHGCLGISNVTLPPGTPVDIMMFAPEDEGKIGNTIFKKQVPGRILGRADLSENCPALADDVREWNERSGFAFYTVAREDGQSLGPDALGIGIVHPQPKEDPFDLNGNGEADGFSVCNGRFGLTFAVWIDEPHEGDVLGSKSLSSDALGSQLTWTGILDLRHALAGVPNCRNDL